MSKTRLLVLASLGTLLLGPTTVAQQDDGYAVIVNTANPTSSISARELAQIYLKRRTNWGDGRKIEPVDLPPDSRVRARFTRVIHGRSVDAIKAFWTRQVFAGHSVPPVELTESQVLAFVRANVGSIGYVTVSAARGGGGNVKVVTVTR